MEKEYLFYDQSLLEYPIDESIEVSNVLDESEYIVSNISEAKSEIYEQEIYFYVKKSHVEIS